MESVVKAKAKAKLEAAEKVKLEADVKAKLEAEDKTKFEAEEKAKLESVQKATKLIVKDSPETLQQQATGHFRKEWRCKNCLRGVQGSSTCVICPRSLSLLVPQLRCSNCRKWKDPGAFSNDCCYDCE